MTLVSTSRVHSETQSNLTADAIWLAVRGRVCSAHPLSWTAMVLHLAATTLRPGRLAALVGGRSPLILGVGGGIIPRSGHSVHQQSLPTPLGHPLSLTTSVLRQAKGALESGHREVHRGILAILVSGSNTSSVPRLSLTTPTVLLRRSTTAVLPQTAQAVHRGLHEALEAASR